MRKAFRAGRSPKAMRAARSALSPAFPLGCFRKTVSKAPHRQGASSAAVAAKAKGQATDALIPCSLLRVRP